MSFYTCSPSDCQTNRSGRRHAEERARTLESRIARIDPVRDVEMLRMFAGFPSNRHPGWTAKLHDLADRLATLIQEPAS